MFDTRVLFVIAAFITSGFSNLLAQDAQADPTAAFLSFIKARSHDLRYSP